MILDIDIPRVSEEDYRGTRKAVEATGAFIASIKVASIEDLLAEDRNRSARRFNYRRVSSSKTMRAIIPPEMEVFIDPQAVRIEGSNRLPTSVQKAKIVEADMSFKYRLPEWVRSFVSLNMVDPATYSQLEDAWMDAGRGLLFPSFLARTDVQTVRGFDAEIGRLDRSERRRVDGWFRSHGRVDVFAVPVGVLPRRRV